MHTWSKIRDKLENEYLAPSLRGRIQYYAVSYSKSPDHNGRAAVRLDGKEILKSCYHEAMTAYYYAIPEEYPDIDMEKRHETAYRRMLEKGCFDQKDIYEAFDIFDNQSIEKSLESENALVRMFAVLDRRTGKRRLKNLQEKAMNEPEWLRQFYYIRLEAEKIKISSENGGI